MKVGSTAFGDVRASGDDHEWRELRDDIDQPPGGVVSVDGCILVARVHRGECSKEPADGDQ